MFSRLGFGAALLAAALSTAAIADHHSGFSAADAQRVFDAWDGHFVGEGRFRNPQTGEWSPRQLVVESAFLPDGSAQFIVNGGEPSRMAYADGDFVYSLANGQEVTTDVRTFDVQDNGDWRMETFSIQPGPGGVSYEMFEIMTFENGAITRQLNVREEGSDVELQTMFEMTYRRQPNSR